ncbi:MAG TPA: energy transducer TonB [Thermoanaerobaculia bacterium]|nr:energy transducer TonB [Thermoanaerobaculia bacterium]
MFETSVVHAQTRAASGRLSLFTISVLAHSAVIIGAVAFSIASVDFPTSAPDEYSQAPVLLPVLVPPPLGRPDGGAVRQPVAQRPATPPPQPQQPNQITAPPSIPDEVPQLEVASTGDSNATGDPNATAPGPLGQPWGVEGGVGDLDGPPAIVAATPVPEKIYEAHEVKAPVGRYRPAPPYPTSLIRTKLRATVVVRCVIDKNGHVRDPRVVVPAAFAPFNDSVVNTVQRWRFTPGSLNGVAVETYLDLTVNFGVN